MWAYPRLRTGKRAKVVANLLHVSSYRGSNIIHTEHWTQSWLNNAQMLPFCFSPISITSCLCRKDTRLSMREQFAFRESLGMRLLPALTLRWCVCSVCPAICSTICSTICSYSRVCTKHNEDSCRSLRRIVWVSKVWFVCQQVNWVKALWWS